MRVSSALIKAVSIIVCVFWLAGCVQNKSVPGYARSGDVIVLGLGGIHRNALSEPALKPQDLTITITDSNNQTYALQGLNIFKAYGDYTSTLNHIIIDGSLDDLALMPYDGTWYITVPLTVPGNNSSPLPLAVGQASISVTSPKLVNTALLTEGNLTDIPIEIIPGVAVFDNAYNNQFNTYRQSKKNFNISPNDLTNIDLVGGAYFVINYSNESLFSSGKAPIVLPSNHNPFVQLSYNVVSNGDGTGTIYALLLNPAGFTTMSSAVDNSSLLADLTVKMEYYASDANDIAIQSTFSLDTANSYYIDVNGDVIAGLQPQMIHHNNL